jgi:hypothetical protein
LIVMAVEMPVRDQPVSTDIGWRNTASENIAPMLTQVMSAPAATMTQPYAGPLARVMSCSTLEALSQHSS